MDASLRSVPFKERVTETSRLAGLAVRLTWRASPRLVFAILLLVLLQALLPTLELVLSKTMIDRAALDLGIAEATSPLAERLPFAAWIVLAAGVVALGQLIQPFAATFQDLAGDRLTGYVTGQLISAANRWQGLERFEDPGFADDLHRAREHAAHGGLDLMIFGAPTVVVLFTIVGLALALAGLHPLVPVLILLATLPQMARQREYHHRTGSHIYVQTPESRRLEYSRDTLLTPEPAKDVRLYGLGPFFHKRYEEGFERATGALDRLRRRLAKGISLATALSALAVAAVYAYVVFMVARDSLTLGDLLLYGGAATMLQMRLLDLGDIIGFLPLVLGFLPSLFRVLEAPPDLPLPERPRPAPEPIRHGIAFEDVHFAYPGRPEPVLRGVSFGIRPGESLALVGHNGAGKTTIVKLLLRMYDPDAGRITLDGADLREYDLHDLRSHMGVIFQDFVHYELTAGENIGLGQAAALQDDDRLLAAAERAGAAELIQSLPDGLDTQLGREFGGRELSGGEWQKLALARAFVRDCQLLVLDEPTAALDVQTEYDIYSRFHDLTHGKMTLLISHRFSTVRMADRILYLADGRVQEEGSHAELMARDGEYARLYCLQAGQYAEADSKEMGTWTA